jgi:SnoaL-like domain
MSTEEKNRALVCRFLEAQSEGDLEALDELLAPDFVDHGLLPGHDPGREGFMRGLEEDLRRDTSEDIVILINRGTFRGHERVRQLAQMLREELPEHRSFEYTYRAVEGRMAFLEWAYEDENVRVRDGADSYLIENGKIVAQTIHYTVEQK